MLLTTAGAFFLRFAVVLFVFRGVALLGINHDEFGWEMGWVARSIASGQGFSSPFAPAFTGPTALVPPLYPYLLSVVFRVFGLYSPSAAFVILTFNSLCSALTCLPVYLIARENGGIRVARWAVVLWAIYPFSIYFSATQVWDYSLTALLLAVAWYLALHTEQQRSAIVGARLGLLFGIAALSNPSVLSALAVALTLAVWRLHRSGGRSFRFGGIVLLTMVLTLLPWCFRNTHVLHAAVPLRDGFWLECWAGNHGDTFTSNPSSSHPASDVEEMKLYMQYGEIRYIMQKRSLAIRFIKAHPTAFVMVSVRRVLRFWTGFWSFKAAYLSEQPLDLPNVFFCSGVSVLMWVGVYRSWRMRHHGVVAMMMMLALFPVPYYLTHASVDYRQPIEPEIIVMVALGLPFAARSQILHVGRWLRG